MDIKKLVLGIMEWFQMRVSEVVFVIRMMHFIDIHYHIERILC